MFESIVSLMCTSFFHLTFLQCNNSRLTLVRLFMIWVVLTARPPLACAHCGVSVPYPASFVRLVFLSSFLHTRASQHPDAVRSPVKRSGLCTRPTARTPCKPSDLHFLTLRPSLVLDKCGSPPTRQQIQVSSPAHALSKRCFSLNLAVGTPRCRTPFPLSFVAPDLGGYA